jgi:hypothetical protein
MRHSDASARAGFPKCSPSALRSASSALLLLLAACGGAAVSTQPTNVSFTEVAATTMSTHTGDARLLVTADAAELARVVPNVSAPTGRTFVAALQGQQRTGGYMIRITSIERQGSKLVVHATFTAPPRDSIVIQVLTSPAHVVSVASADVSGAREALLLDAVGVERARLNIP